MAYGFEEICKFKVGERYWESSQYGSVHFEVISEPEVKKTRGGVRQVAFEAKAVRSKQILHYLMTEGLEHYGPKIYDHEMYQSPGSFGL